MSLYIGLMSGTSMDGVDAAVVDIKTNRLIAGITRPYSEKAKQFLFEVISSKTVSLSALSQLNSVLGQEFALAVQQLLQTTAIAKHDVVAIGSHGQTIAHDVMADIPYTIQLGCAHTISELTGITVVADFRTRDLVVGGQGAPFAPLFHQALFSSLNQAMAVVNIGGIANVTYLTADGHMSGHDVGPGNCLMDAWVQKHLNKPYDANGAWAATGSIINPLLSNLYADPFFQRSIPKSIGKEYFSLDWLMPYVHADYTPQDIQATLSALSVRCIADAIENAGFDLQRLSLCGGGVHNQTLVAGLQEQLPHLIVESTQSIGVDPDFLEAMMFAWLAEKTMNRIPVDLTQITGAKNPAILGAIFAGGIDKGISNKV